MTPLTAPSTLPLSQPALSQPALSEPGADRLLAAALEDAHREIATLREGLERRTVIGEAVGITMVRAGITADAAFARLVALSQDRNIKVRDLAQRIVDEADELAAGAWSGFLDRVSGQG